MWHSIYRVRFFDSLFGLNDKQEGSKTKGRVFVCHPQDLKERLDLYYSDNKSYSKDDIDNFITSMKGFFKDSDDSSKCDDWIIERYKEVSSKTIMSTSYPAEIQFTDKWNTCNAMPEWLNSKLNEYIEQNKNDDKAYIEASKFKESWQTSERLSGTKEYSSTRMEELTYEIAKKSVINCKAIKVATQAIENDLIDLGNGKKAKCADLSYKDAQKCLSYYHSVYRNTYEPAKKESDIKQERKKYEQKNKQ